MRRALVILAVVFWTAGCASVVVEAPKTSLPSGTTPEQAWTRVLETHVDAQGRVDFAGVAREPKDLEAYVASLATAELFGDPKSHLADLINAYNALALYNVVRSGIPPELDSQKVKFFYSTKFPVGGRTISLYDLENKVIRPVADARVHAALNCMVRSCPRLPREPFRQATLDAQLDAVAREFFNEDRNVRIEPGGDTVRFSEILKFYTEDFLKEAPSLVAYANRWRESKIPEGMKSEFIPYDWTTNSR
jgi:Protein of unknown function, DUF547